VAEGVSIVLRGHDPERLREPLRVSGIRTSRGSDEGDSISTAIQLDSSFRRVRFRMSAYSITTVLSRVVPCDVARDLVSEMHVFLKRSLYNRSSLCRLTSLDSCGVNVGCGDRPTPGWINLELQSAPNIHFWDCDFQRMP
jgi:hypothetical protein